ncbi:MAG: transposase [Bacteroidia bacterium]|jgi:transposase
MQGAQKEDVLQEVVSLSEFAKLKSENAYLKHQLAELKRLIYGAKSERFILDSKDQLHLFDQQPTEQDPKTEQITYERNKAKKENPPVRTALPAHLPRVEEIIEPENLSDNAKKIGEEITEILEYNPANIFVRRIVRPKYAQENSITIAELPSLPLPKSNAGASMLAYIAVSKFVDHLPFYRQRQIFKRQKLEISDSTLGGWFNAASKLIVPLYEQLTQKVLNGNYLQMDESPIGVQDAHKPGALHTGYHWVIHNPIERLVLFKYAKSRSGVTPQTILTEHNFKGTLQTDGYAVYQALSNDITLLGCLAHGRRYFEKALQNDSKRARYALEQIQLLYKIERKAKEREISNAALKRYRQLYAKPILQHLKKWMEQQATEVLPKSLMAKAITYNLHLWSNISRYVEDGSYHIDNNLIENTIRPLALGRKNYMFAGSHGAAQNAAMFYSFFATCKVNNIEPMAWLTDVLNRINETKITELDQLLPTSNWKQMS